MVVPKVRKCARADCLRAVPFHEGEAPSAYSRRGHCSASCAAKGRQRPLAERFPEKVARGPGCWLWQGTTNGAYGQIGDGGRKRYAHRVAWELQNGPVPDGLHVLHRCDVPACVRPDHLFLGTPSDNLRDCYAKGRRSTSVRRGRLGP
jgi:hypothetical protein